MMVNLYLFRKETGVDGCFGTIYAESGDAVVRSGEHPTSKLEAGAYILDYVSNVEGAWEYRFRDSGDHAAVQAAAAVGDLAFEKRNDLSGLLSVGRDIGIIAGQRILLDSVGGLADLIAFADGDSISLTISRAGAEVARQEPVDEMIPEAAMKEKMVVEVPAQVPTVSNDDIIQDDMNSGERGLEMF